MLIFFVLYFSANILSGHEAPFANIEDGNKKTKKYNQVPNDELIFEKLQAQEPAYFYSGSLRGKGHNELYANILISELKKNNIPVYVDYFTSAKAEFYDMTEKYQTCSRMTLEFKQYKQYFSNKRMYNKHLVIAVPHVIRSPYGKIAIHKDKINQVKKHFFKDTKIVNIKSLINDDQLKTTQLIGEYSGIAEHIYPNYLSNGTISQKFKKHVYEFVASDGIQIPLMLNGRRMDYAEMTRSNDYYINKLNFQNTLFLYDYSSLNPNQINLDNYIVDFYMCLGTDLKKLKKVIDIFSKKAKELRTNQDFINYILKKFHNDTNTPYVPAENNPFYKEMIILKKEIDSGYFDVP